MTVWFCQIVALNKTKEKMRPYQGNQEDEDPDIKKIKKVNMESFVCKGWRVGWGVFRILVCIILFIYLLNNYSQIASLPLPFCPL